jgi:phytoene dehydrogenase-like protein
MVAMAGFSKSFYNAGVPIGGSQQVVFGIAELYKQLGGEIHYKSRATDVIVRNDQATGVRLEDGTEHPADIVVWAGDGHKLIFDILGGRYLSEEIKHMYSQWTPVLPLVHVAIGVARDMSKEPHRILFELDKAITVAGEEHRWMCFLHHSFDPTMAPPGKSAVEVWYATRYDYWERLSQDRAAYEAEKKRIAEATIAELDRRWPGFASQVEVVDVPTPATYVRYTGNWQGSPDGWYITPDNMGKWNLLRTLPGLSGLYMVGQWTAPFTGTVFAATSGRQLIQLLCKQSKTPFVTYSERT